MSTTRIRALLNQPLNPTEEGLLKEPGLLLFWTPESFERKRQQICTCLQGTIIIPTTESKISVSRHPSKDLVDSSNNNTVANERDEQQQQQQQKPREMVDLWVLRSLALSQGGFLCPDLRKQVWPKLFAVHEQILKRRQEQEEAKQTNGQRNEAAAAAVKATKSNVHVTATAETPLLGNNNNNKHQQTPKTPHHPSLALLKRHVSRTLWKVQKYKKLVHKHTRQQQAQFQAVVEEHQRRQQLQQQQQQQQLVLSSPLLFSPNPDLRAILSSPLSSITPSTTATSSFLLDSPPPPAGTTTSARNSDALSFSSPSFSTPPRSRSQQQRIPTENHHHHREDATPHSWRGNHYAHHDLGGNGGNRRYPPPRPSSRWEQHKTTMSSSPTMTTSTSSSLIRARSSSDQDTNHTATSSSQYPEETMTISSGSLHSTSSTSCTASTTTNVLMASSSSSSSLLPSCSLDPYSGFPVSMPMATKSRRATSREKSLLYNLLVLTPLERCHYNGVQDLAAVCLLNLESPSLTRLLLERLSSHHLNEWWQYQSMHNSKSQNRTEQPESKEPLFPKYPVATIVSTLLGVVDLELYHLLEPYFGADLDPILFRWSSTWFAQDLLDATLMSRLLDLFLVSHPAMPLYVSAALLTTHKQVFELMMMMDSTSDRASTYQRQQDENRSNGSHKNNNNSGATVISILQCIMHCLSTELHRAHAQHRLEGIVQKATSYMRRIPPSDLEAMADSSQSQRHVNRQGKVLRLLHNGTPSWMSLSQAPTDAQLLREAEQLRLEQEKREQETSQLNAYYDEAALAHAATMAASPSTPLTRRNVRPPLTLLDRPRGKVKSPSHNDRVVVETVQEKKTEKKPLKTVSSPSSPVTTLPPQTQVLLTGARPTAHRTPIIFVDDLPVSKIELRSKQRRTQKSAVRLFILGLAWLASLMVLLWFGALVLLDNEDVARGLASWLAEAKRRFPAELDEWWETTIDRVLHPPTKRSIIRSSTIPRKDNKDKKAIAMDFVDESVEDRADIERTDNSDELEYWVSADDTLKWYETLYLKESDEFVGPEHIQEEFTDLAQSKPFDLPTLKDEESRISDTFSFEDGNIAENRVELYPTALRASPTHEENVGNNVYLVDPLKIEDVVRQVGRKVEEYQGEVDTTIETQDVEFTSKQSAERIDCDYIQDEDRDHHGTDEIAAASHPEQHKFRKTVSPFDQLHVQSHKFSTSTEQQGIGSSFMRANSHRNTVPNQREEIITQSDVRMTSPPVAHVELEDGTKHHQSSKEQVQSQSYVSQLEDSNSDVAPGRDTNIALETVGQVEVLNRRSNSDDDEAPTLAEKVSHRLPPFYKNDNRVVDNPSLAKLGPLLQQVNDEGNHQNAPRYADSDSSREQSDVLEPLSHCAADVWPAIVDQTSYAPEPREPESCTIAQASKTPDSILLNGKMIPRKLDQLPTIPPDDELPPTASNYGLDNGMELDLPSVTVQHESDFSNSLASERSFSDSDSNLLLGQSDIDEPALLLPLTRDIEWPAPGQRPTPADDTPAYTTQINQQDVRMTAQAPKTSDGSFKNGKMIHHDRHQLPTIPAHRINSVRHIPAVVNKPDDNLPGRLAQEIRPELQSIDSKHFYGDAKTLTLDGCASGRDLDHSPGQLLVLPLVKLASNDDACPASEESPFDNDSHRSGLSDVDEPSLLLPLDRYIEWPAPGQRPAPADDTPAYTTQINQQDVLMTAEAPKTSDGSFKNGKIIYHDRRELPTIPVRRMNVVKQTAAVLSKPDNDMPSAHSSVGLAEEIGPELQSLDHEHCIDIPRTVDLDGSVAHRDLKLASGQLGVLLLEQLSSNDNACPASDESPFDNDSHRSGLSDVDEPSRLLPLDHDIEWPAPGQRPAPADDTPAYTTQINQQDVLMTAQAPKTSDGSFKNGKIIYHDRRELPTIPARRMSIVKQTAAVLSKPDNDVPSAHSSVGLAEEIGPELQSLDHEHCIDIPRTVDLDSSVAHRDLKLASGQLGVSPLVPLARSDDACPASDESPFDKDSYRSGLSDVDEPSRLLPLDRDIEWPVPRQRPTPADDTPAYMTQINQQDNLMTAQPPKTSDGTFKNGKIIYHDRRELPTIPARRMNVVKQTAAVVSKPDNDVSSDSNVRLAEEIGPELQSLDDVEHCIDNPKTEELDGSVSDRDLMLSPGQLGVLPLEQLARSDDACPASDESPFDNDSHRSGLSDVEESSLLQPLARDIEWPAPGQRPTPADDTPASTIQINQQDVLMTAQPPKTSDGTFKNGKIIYHDRRELPTIPARRMSVVKHAAAVVNKPDNYVPSAHSNVGHAVEFEHDIVVLKTPELVDSITNGDLQVSPAALDEHLSLHQPARDFAWPAPRQLPLHVEDQAVYAPQSSKQNAPTTAQASKISETSSEKGRMIRHQQDLLPSIPTRRLLSVQQAPVVSSTPDDPSTSDEHDSADEICEAGLQSTDLEYKYFAAQTLELVDEIIFESDLQPSKGDFMKEGLSQLLHLVPGARPAPPQSFASVADSTADFSAFGNAFSATAEAPKTTGRIVENGQMIRHHQVQLPVVSVRRMPADSSLAKQLDSPYSSGHYDIVAEEFDQELLSPDRRHENDNRNSQESEEGEIAPVDITQKIPAQLALAKSMDTTPKVRQVVNSCQYWEDADNLDFLWTWVATVKASYEDLTQDMVPTEHSVSRDDYQAVTPKMPVVFYGLEKPCAHLADRSLPRIRIYKLEQLPNICLSLSNLGFHRPGPLRVGVDGHPLLLLNSTVNLERIAARWQQLGSRWGDGEPLAVTEVEEKNPLHACKELKDMDSAACWQEEGNTWDDEFLSCFEADNSSAFKRTQDTNIPEANVVRHLMVEHQDSLSSQLDRSGQNVNFVNDEVSSTSLRQKIILDETETGTKNASLTCNFDVSANEIDSDELRSPANHCVDDSKAEAPEQTSGKMSSFPHNHEKLHTVSTARITVPTGRALPTTKSTDLNGISVAQCWADADELNSLWTHVGILKSNEDDSDAQRVFGLTETLTEADDVSEEPEVVDRMMDWSTRRRSESSICLAAIILPWIDVFIPNELPDICRDPSKVEIHGPGPLQMGVDGLPFVKLNATVDLEGIAVRWQELGNIWGHGKLSSVTEKGEVNLEGEKSKKCEFEQSVPANRVENTRIMPVPLDSKAAPYNDREGDVVSHPMVSCDTFGSNEAPATSDIWQTISEGDTEDLQAEAAESTSPENAGYHRREKNRHKKGGLTTDFQVAGKETLLTFPASLDELFSNNPPRSIDLHQVNVGAPSFQNISFPACRMNTGKPHDELFDRGMLKKQHCDELAQAPESARTPPTDSVDEQRELRLHSVCLLTELKCYNDETHFTLLVAHVTEQSPMRLAHDYVTQSTYSAVVRQQITGVGSNAGSNSFHNTSLSSFEAAIDISGWHGTSEHKHGPLQRGADGVFYLNLSASSASVENISDRWHELGLKWGDKKPEVVEETGESKEEQINTGDRKKRFSWIRKLGAKFGSRKEVNEMKESEQDVTRTMANEEVTRESKEEDVENNNTDDDDNEINTTNNNEDALLGQEETKVVATEDDSAVWPS
ncbi:hypothetical protein ACA910_009218 [Epithemia clementina (nom. ined.)]